MDLYEKTYFIVNVFSVTRSTINAVDTLLKKNFIVLQITQLINYTKLA